MRDRHHARRDGGACAAARAAGGDVEIPRVVRGAIGDGLGGHRRSEFGQVGLAADHEAGGAEAFDEPCVLRLDPARVLRHLQAAVVRVAGGVRDRVLEQERHAAERPGRQIGVGGLESRPCRAGRR